MSRHIHVHLPAMDRANRRFRDAGEIGKFHRDRAEKYKRMMEEETNPALKVHWKKSMEEHIRKAQHAETVGK